MGAVLPVQPEPRNHWFANNHPDLTGCESLERFLLVFVGVLSRNLHRPGDHVGEGLTFVIQVTPAHGGLPRVTHKRRRHFAPFGDASPPLRPLLGQSDCRHVEKEVGVSRPRRDNVFNSFQRGKGVSIIRESQVGRLADGPSPRANPAPKIPLPVASETIQPRPILLASARRRLRLFEEPVEHVHKPELA